MYTHLDQVHEAVVAVLQEVDAELAQEKAHIEGRASLAIVVPSPQLSLGDFTLRLAHVVRVILKLWKTASCCKPMDTLDTEWSPR